MSLLNLQSFEFPDLVVDTIHTLNIDAIGATGISIGQDGITTSVSIGTTGTAINIKGHPYNVNNVIENAVAFFTGTTSNDIDDTDIIVTDSGHSLQLTNLGSVYSNNYFSSTGDIIIGGAADATIGIGNDVGCTGLALGHEGLTVTISDGLQTNFVLASSLDRNSIGTLNIGLTNATQVVIGKPGTDVTINDTVLVNNVDVITPLNVLSLGPTRTSEVQLGNLTIPTRTLGAFNANFGIGFTSGGFISDRTPNTQVTMDYTSAVASPSAVVVDYFKENNIVTVMARATSLTAPIATAASAIIFSGVLPGALRPIISVSFPCIVFTATIGPVVAPGVFFISDTGVMSVAPLNATFTIGQACGLEYGVSVSFSNS